MRLARIQPRMQVVDVGCGRGEIVLNSVLSGASAWGLDYSQVAVRLARQALSATTAGEMQSKLALLQANAIQLPFPEGSVDIVFMLDVVEHLYPSELKAALDEAWRILKHGGRLVVHTMPNLWYYRFGYPVYRGLQRLRGQHLPSDPRQRWSYSHVHVNEQTPSRLKSALQNSRFKARVWLASTQSYEYERNLMIKTGMSFLTSVYPFRWIFCNDIFAVGEK